MMKDLESKLTQYSSKLVEVTSPSNNNGNIFKTSPLLRTLDEIGYHIFRVDVSQMNGRGDGDTSLRNKNLNSLFVDKIYNEYVTYFGRLPWITNVEEISSLETTYSSVNNVTNYEHGNLIFDSDHASNNNNSLTCIEDNEEENEELGNDNRKFTSQYSMNNINQKLDLLSDDVKTRVLHNVTDVSKNIFVVSSFFHINFFVVTKLFSCKRFTTYC